MDIAVGQSSTTKTWINKQYTWEELVDKFSKPVVTNETYAEYLKAPKQEQNLIKDVGGYVGGYLENGQRHAVNVKHRELVTLDVDFGNANIWWDFIMLYGCAAAIHSTHKHGPNNIRLRLIIPLSRPVSIVEYEAIARKIAGDVGIDLFDSTTFQVHRLMYWPSVSSDGEYLFEHQDGPMLDADVVLGCYDDWTDQSSWPSNSIQAKQLETNIRSQENPLEKTGLVGAFCRAYSITEAIETFLADVYAPTTEDRYSYIGGTTAGGLVIYDDVFAYSHHSTDPTSGRLCNAYDLVRIHLFGYLDTSQAKKESNTRMESLVMADHKVKFDLVTSTASEDFGSPYEPDATEEDLSWIKQLETDNRGQIMSSTANIGLIMKNDIRLKNTFATNIFDHKPVVMNGLPWRSIDGKQEEFKDVDYSGLRIFFESVYKILGPQKIEDVLRIEFEDNKFHPIRDYLSSLTWDGEPRVNMLLTDYLGADDSAYTQAAIRKALVGAVARVFDPGVKFDLVLTLIGKQGIGKSTLFRKLGKDWYTDSFTTFKGKDAYEQVQGMWIVEMSELSALNKSDVENVKQFISKTDDYYRPAYGRTSMSHPRQCVFMGTTNDVTFLKDPSGNRRFLPVILGVYEPISSVFIDLDDSTIDNIWAEAFDMYINGEDLFLDSAVEVEAIDAQAAHTEVDNRSGTIETYVNLLLPATWDSYDIHKRISWLDDPTKVVGTEERQFVCTMEIWTECFKKDKADITQAASRDIKAILTKLGWVYSKSSGRVFPIHGGQRFFTKSNYIREYKPRVLSAEQQASRDRIKKAQSIKPKDKKQVRQEVKLDKWDEARAKNIALHTKRREQKALKAKEYRERKTNRTDPV